MRNSGVVPAIAVLSLLSAAACAADAERGAAVPWQRYEAEQAKTNAAVVGPDFQTQSPAREASGRRYVRLVDVGDHVEFTATADAQGLVVRYGIPDDQGVAADATLSLFINGKPSDKLSLTARWSHLYGPYPFGNDAAAGSPRNFWDEARLLPGTIHAGDVVRLEKTADDAAHEYQIDFIELEPVSLAIAKPADALAVTDFGATPDDASDDRSALIAAIAAARAKHQPVWIPAGRFVIGGAIDLDDVTLQGAGMWYTTLVGVDDYTPARRLAMNGNGSRVTLSDFAIIGKLDHRNDSEPNDGIGGSFGTGSTIRNLWVEHTKTGAWLTNSDGLIVEGCRFRNTVADGINLCLGMHGTIVRDCTARGTGDDCFAMWPATYAKATYTHGDNRFDHCTAELPFLAQGFSIYGGQDNAVTDCAATDIPYGCGILASTTFATVSGFGGTTRFERNRIVRAGDREGAIGTVANRIDLIGLHFDDIDVIDSPHDAVRFMSVHGRALRDTTIDHVRVQRFALAGEGHGIASADDAVGAVTISNTSVAGGNATKAFRNVSPAFGVSWGEGTAALQGEPTKAADAKW